MWWKMFVFAPIVVSSGTTIALWKIGEKVDPKILWLLRLMVLLGAITSVFGIVILMPDVLESVERITTRYGINIYSVIAESGRIQFGIGALFVVVFLIVFFVLSAPAMEENRVENRSAALARYRAFLGAKCSDEAYAQLLAVLDFSRGNKETAEVYFLIAMLALKMMRSGVTVSLPVDASVTLQSGGGSSGGSSYHPHFRSIKQILFRVVHLDPELVEAADELRKLDESSKASKDL